MCSYASLVVLRGGKALYVPGEDSHSRILWVHGVPDDSDTPGFARVEFTPPEEEGGKWVLDVEDSESLEWWTGAHERAALSGLERLREEESRGFETVFPDGEWIRGVREDGMWKWRERVYKDGTWDTCRRLEGGWVEEEYLSHGGWGREKYSDGKRERRSVCVLCGVWRVSAWGRKGGEDWHLQEEVWPSGAWERKYRKGDDRWETHVEVDGSWTSSHVRWGGLRWQLKVGADGSWRRTWWDEYGFLRGEEAVDVEGERRVWRHDGARRRRVNG